jgi:hypothetical protein
MAVFYIIIAENTNESFCDFGEENVSGESLNFVKAHFPV